MPLYSDPNKPFVNPRDARYKNLRLVLAARRRKAEHEAFCREHGIDPGNPYLHVRMKVGKKTYYAGQPRQLKLF